MHSETNITKWDRKQLPKIHRKCDIGLLQCASGDTKCDRNLKKCIRYYKVWSLLQSVTDCYYKVCQVLQGVTDCFLQSALGITKCDSYYKMRRNIYPNLGCLNQHEL